MNASGQFNKTHWKPEGLHLQESKLEKPWEE